MDTAATLGKTPALCSWFTLLTASPVRRAALEESLSSGESISWEKVTGLWYCSQSSETNGFFRIANIQLLCFKAKQKDQSEPLMFSSLCPFLGDGCRSTGYFQGNILCNSDGQSLQWTCHGWQPTGWCGHRRSCSN